MNTKQDIEKFIVENCSFPIQMMRKYNESIKISQDHGHNIIWKLNKDLPDEIYGTCSICGSSEFVFYSHLIRDGYRLLAECKK